MCGIFGAIFQGPPEERHRTKVMRVIEALAAFNVSRGDDATGIAVVDTNQAFRLFRMTEPSNMAMQDPEWERALQSVSSRTCAILGHTRQGTHGKNILENTHPFVEGAVIGTHNGTIYNYWGLSKEAYENDSRCLFSLLGTTGLGTPMELANRVAKHMEDVSGGFALAFVLHGVPMLLRNNSNPCFIVRLPKLGNAILYSSEAPHLSMALAYAGLRDENPEALPPLSLHVYPWGCIEPETVAVACDTDYSYYPPQTNNTPKALPKPSVDAPTCTVQAKDVLNHSTCQPGEKYTEYTTNFDVAIRCSQCEVVDHTRTVRLVNGRTICISCHSKRLYTQKCDYCGAWKYLHVQSEETKGRKLCHDCFIREGMKDLFTSAGVNAC